MYVHIFILRICARRRRCLRGFRWYPYFVYSSGAVSGIRGKQMTPAVASERSIFSENHDYNTYGWALQNTPRQCNCGKTFTSDHAMVCHMGGFPTIRHNEVRDITASLLTEVCSNVATEPHLQPLSGEAFRLASANTDDGARLDIRARGFWRSCQDAYFDVRVFHPNAPSNSSRSLSAAYKKHEDEKKRTYGQRILEIERGVFTPLVLTTTGGMGREAQTFYKRLADLLSQKREMAYSSLMCWLRCKTSFAILRSAVMCIRGSRSSRHHAIRDSDIALACSDGCVPHLP